MRRPHLVWTEPVDAAPAALTAPPPAPAAPDPMAWASAAPAVEIEDDTVAEDPPGPPAAVPVPVPVQTPSTSLPEVARKRGLQTFVEGLVIDVAVACAVLILASVESITSRGALIAFGIALTKTVLLAAAAYVVRRYGDRSGVAFLYDVSRQRWSSSK